MADRLFKQAGRALALAGALSGATVELAHGQNIGRDFQRDTARGIGGAVGDTIRDRGDEIRADYRDRRRERERVRRDAARDRMDRYEADREISRAARQGCTNIMAFTAQYGAQAEVAWREYERTGNEQYLRMFEEASALQINAINTETEEYVSVIRQHGEVLNPGESAQLILDARPMIERCAQSVRSVRNSK